MLFLFIFGAVLALTGAGLVALRTKTFEEGTRYEKTVPFWLVGTPVLALGLLLMLGGSVYSQDPGEVIVIKGPGGSIVETDTTSGFGTTLPWNSRITFNIRNQRIEMWSHGGDQGDDGPAIQAPLKNGSNVAVSITVRYSIKPDCVEDIYRTHKSQDNLLDNVLRPGLRDEVRVATAEYTAFQVKQNSADLAATLVDELNDRWSEDCVNVDNVDLGELILPEATETALDAVNERELQEEAARADLERAKVEAETTKTEAQAQADADQIIRCGATTKTETREVNGEATEVVVVVPKSGAACENRLNEQVLVNNYIEMMETLAAEGNLVVLPNGVDVNSLINLGDPAAAAAEG